MKTDRFVVIGGKKMKSYTVVDHKGKDIYYFKSLKCNFIALKITYKGIQLKALWIKMKGQEIWEMLISTDTSLIFSFEEYYFLNVGLNAQNILKSYKLNFNGHFIFFKRSFFLQTINF